VKCEKSGLFNQYFAISKTIQVCVQLSTPAVNVALPAFATARCCGADRAAIIDISYPPGPQQQTRRTLLQRANWNHGRTPYRYTEPAPHTMQAVPIKHPYYSAVIKKNMAYRDILQHAV